MSKPEIGSIGWVDLTISNAEEVRDFYAQVVGWRPAPLDMGGYRGGRLTPHRPSRLPSIGTEPGSPKPRWRRPSGLPPP
jgi:predicted enzyme related to lactoylglutathione lyase